MTADGRRVLVVEDDFFVALETSDLLKEIGCEIVGPASDLATALRLAHSERLDVAVLDIGIRGEMIWPVAEGVAAPRRTYRISVRLFARVDVP